MSIVTECGYSQSLRPGVAFAVTLDYNTQLHSLFPYLVDVISHIGSLSTLFQIQSSMDSLALIKHVLCWRRGCWYAEDLFKQNMQF